MSTYSGLAVRHISRSTNQSLTSVQEISSEMNFLSLFCGCGGIDLGFVKQGYRCIDAFDINRSAIKTHNANLGKKATYKDLSHGLINYEFHKKPSLLVAGPPCQGFSNAGKRLENDPRNRLLLNAGIVATHYRIPIALIENVPGVTTGKMKFYWQELEYIFRANGYKVLSIKCHTEDYGIAQMRKRMLMLAWLDDRLFNFSPPKSPIKTLHQAISSIGTESNHNPVPLDKKSKNFMIAQNIKQGQKLCNVRSGYSSVHTWNIPEVFGHTTVKERKLLESIIKLRRRNRKRDHGDADPVPIKTVESIFGSEAQKLIKTLNQKSYIKIIDDTCDLRNTFNGKFRRLSWNKPSPTVDTRFGESRYFLHPIDNRGFTVREAARIQGFPDHYTFHGNEIDRYKMIGNAIPPPLAEFWAAFIKDYLL